MASKLYNFSPEQLQSLLDSSNTYTEILRAAGINSSSSTNTLKRIINEYKLDTSKFEENRKVYKQQMAKNLYVQNMILNRNYIKILKYKVIN